MGAEGKIRTLQGRGEERKCLKGIQIEGEDSTRRLTGQDEPQSSTDCHGANGVWLQGELGCVWWFSCGELLRVCADVCVVFVVVQRRMTPEQVGQFRKTLRGTNVGSCGYMRFG